MQSRTRTRTTRTLAALATAALAGTALLATSTPAAASRGETLWVNPDSSTTEHITEMKLKGQARDDARLLAGYATATWFTGETPKQVRNAVRDVVRGADRAHAVPTLVAYNLPFRDCSQYSAGGATSQAAYEAWIEGFAAGIGDERAIVVLEPDGLGIIPWYTTFEGTQEWCQPAEADPATAADERFAMLNHAVDVLAALPNTDVYLDAGHSGWLNVGDNTDRLIKAGVQKADGFYLNASNYQYTENSVAYGRWISSCIALVTEVGGALADCGNQYWNGGPLSDWQGVEMTKYAPWTADPTAPLERRTDVLDDRYAQALGGVQPAARFVVDTSRNGQGPWDPATSAVGYDPLTSAEDWCNPPGRGLGPRPTLQTGDPLVAAYLWIKVPGESDGLCYRGLGGPLDPERGIADPAAGQWFVEQARELITLAVPAVSDDERCRDGKGDRGNKGDRDGKDHRGGRGDGDGRNGDRHDRDRHDSGARDVRTSDRGARSR